MGLTLKNLTGYQRGIETAETGINVESFDVRYFPQWKEFLKDRPGLIIGFAVPSVLSREITVTGEINGSTGLMAATHTASVSLANDTADFDASGTIYMDEASVSQGRAAWRALAMRLSSNPSSGVSVTYIGTSTFTLQKQEPRGSAGDVPTTIESWRGKQADRDSFLTSHALNSSHNGGYIIDYSCRDGVAYTEVDLVIGRSPDFQKEYSANGISLKTGTKSANVSEGLATREVSYYAPETRYTYFSSSKPNGPRYDSVAIETQPRIIRSKITVRRENLPDLIYTGALAPADVATATTMAAWDKITSHDSEQIPGTPWYRCVDVVTRELRGDE